MKAKERREGAGATNYIVKVGVPIDTLARGDYSIAIPDGDNVERALIAWINSMQKRNVYAVLPEFVTFQKIQ